MISASENAVETARKSSQTNASGKETLRWRGMENGQEVVLDADPYVGFGSKVAVWFIRLLPVESLL